MFDLMHEWLVRGIAAAKTGNPCDKEAARTCFKQVVRSRATRPEQKACAWLWLSEVEDDPAHKRQCLEKVLTLEPNNPLARHGLALLDGPSREAATPDTPKSNAKPTSAPKAQTIRRYVCPKCGGKLAFNAGRRALICIYCDNHLSELEAIQQGTQASALEQNFLATLPTAKAQRWQLATARAINCQGCGATFTLPPLEITGECPFCGSPHVIEIAPGDDLIEPGGILAFQFDVEIATKHIHVWLEQQIRPEHSARRIVTTRPRGVYLPFWTFDVGGDLIWRSAICDEEEKIRTWNQVGWVQLLTGEAVYTEGMPEAVYADDLLVPASHSLPLNLAREVNDFDTMALSSYTSDLLAGWSTEIYQISLAAASLVARQRVVTDAKQRLLSKTDQRLLRLPPLISTANVLVESYKLVLLPVWIASYHYKRQRCRLVVNGQTGKVTGEKPRNGLQKALAGLLGD